MRVAKTCFGLGLGLLLAGCTNLVFGDMRIDGPPGWTLNQFFHASGGGNVAVAFHEGNPFERTRVMQYREGGTVFTDLPGKAHALEYSADGRLLLAHQVFRTDPPGNHRISLIDGQGAIRWSKNDNRSFYFSSTGEVIYAWQSGDEGGRSSVLEIFDIAGTSVRRVDAGKPLLAGLTLGTGDRVVLGIGHSVIAINPSAGATPVWRIDLPDSDPPLLSFRPVGPGRFIVDLGYGQFKVVNRDGLVEFNYVPAVLAQNSPSRTQDDYAQYEAYAGPSANTLLLYDGTARGLLLNLSTRELTAKQIDATVPPGFTLGRGIGAHKLVLLGSNSIRIRTIE